MKKDENWLLKSKRLVSIFNFLVILICFPWSSYAGEMEVLINKLVEKGVLTPGEGQVILTETKEEVRKEMTQGTSYSLPQWVQSTKLKGDFRLREEWGSRDGDADRWRTRIRYRLGIETKVADQFKVGFGIASGPADPRSTNQSLGDSFSHKPINLDYGFGQYTPADWVTLQGGKFKNPIWTVSDMIWDTDINPEGINAQFNYPFSDSVSLFLNSALFILDEYKADENDPFMYVIQPGVDWKINDMAGLKAAFVYYGDDNVKGNKFNYSANTNTGMPTKLVYDYASYGGTAVLSLKPESIIPAVPYAAVFGDYLYNPDPSDDNQAWQVGLRFGHEKVQSFGQWLVTYSYRNIERDAVLDILPDSDTFGGATDVKGHEGILEFGLAKNVSLQLDYYKMKQIHNPKKDEDLLQIDWNLKF